MCGLVPGCCDNELREMQLRRREREREREKKKLSLLFYETVGGLNPESVGRCEIF